MRPLLYILGPDGEPVPADVVTWGEWFSNYDNRRVAETEVGPGRVSTVCVGCDLGFGSGAHPLLWETMTFGVPGLEDVTNGRYATRVDALAGHEEAVVLARMALQVQEAHATKGSDG